MKCKFDDSNLNKREEEVFETIKSNLDISIIEITKVLSVSESAINRAIRELKQKQYIKCDGSDKNGKWVVLR